MEPEQTYDASTLKSRKSSHNHTSSTVPSFSGPATFFLKSEKEMEKDAQKGGHTLQHSVNVIRTSSGRLGSAQLDDSSFGVQSLEDTISSAFLSERNLARTDSNSSAESRVDGASTTARKRKTRSPVHPTKISATGQQIVLSEQTSPLESHDNSPNALVSSSSPPQNHGRRRGSAASSLNVSQPMTPLKISPHPDFATPSTLRSASPKSFRLSDEEGSVADETNSQAIASSDGDEEEDRPSLDPMPQLVMPSLTMPVRRPFTEIGKDMGRARIMLLGPKGVGKTSLIRSIFHSCEDIVHIDATDINDRSQHSQSTDSSTYRPTKRVTEILASTRSYPSWWTNDTFRLSHSRKSFADGVLERNLTFIDTPGIQEEIDAQLILDHFQASLRRTVNLNCLSDSEIIHLFSGDGGTQIDAVIYVFDPNPWPSDEDQAGHELGSVHRELLQYVCKYSNFIPLIGRADTVSSETLTIRKSQISQVLDFMNAPFYRLSGFGSSGSAGLLSHITSIHEPFAISSAVGDDADIIDASVLMSSQYMQPLIPSELSRFVADLLSPQNLRRMRHSAAVKFVAWIEAGRKSRLDRHHQDQVRSPGSGFEGVQSVGEDPGKVLVPYGTASYYRSASPSISEVSGLSSNAIGGPALAMARLREPTPPSEPFRQVRLAKWAQDLQRSLHNESRRYRDMYNQRPTEWTSEDDSEKHEDCALVSTRDAGRPPRGRLGGDLGVIDPLDPLGVLALGQAFRQHGLIAIQLAGSFGLLGAVAVWVMRHWTDVQDFFGFGQPITMVHVAAVPPPPRHMLGWLDDLSLRALFNWSR